MSKLPKHYSLHSEEKDHFVIHDSRDKKKFKVAKRDLHPAHHADILRLQKLAEGGEVNAPPSMPDQKKAKDAWEGAQHGEMDRLKGYLGLGDKTQPKPKGYAFGGGPTEDTGEDGVEEGVFPSAPQPRESSQPVGGIQPIEQLMAGNVRSPTSGASASWQETTPTVPQGDLGPQAGPQGLVQGYPTSGELKSSIESGISGIKEEASAQQLQNKQLADVYNKNIAEEQKFMSMRMAKLNQYEAKYNDLASQVANSKIDPNHYWSSKSTGGKLAAVFGLMLGGLGAGLTHGPNMAIETLNKQIENDIEAQKQNLGNKRSLLSENLRAQGNMEAALSATRLQMAAIAAGRLQQVAAESGNPIIAARAQQHAAAIQQSTIPARIALANNEIQMHIKKDVLTRLASTGQPGVQPVDMQDLARAGIIDHGTAEKEGAAISKRQQAEAYLTDQVKKLDQEQSVWGDGVIPNIVNPGSYARRDQLRAGIIQAIQSASASKRLNPEMLALEAEPFLTKTLDSQETREAGLNGLIGLIRSHADPTPMASHYKVPGAIGKENMTRKNFQLGPVK